MNAETSSDAAIELTVSVSTGAPLSWVLLVASGGSAAQPCGVVTNREVLEK